MKTDATLQKDVIEELKWQPAIDASEIGVAVNNGIVELFGTVGSYAEKRAAENAALRVEGTKAVAEDIHVKIGANDKRTDSEIAEAIVNTLRWDSLVPDDKIKVKVEDGWVTAEGRVNWIFQKNAVKNAVSNLAGVKGITNLVTVISHIHPSDVQKKITAAFERNAIIDANDIRIATQDDKVTLSGTVRSYVEKRDAEHAAWNVPGIASVVNELEVVVPLSNRT
nr:BON domain-containing protein [uncultured Fluviicola sp.]